MIKKVLLLTFTGLYMLIGNFLTANDNKNCTCREATTTEIVVGVAVIGGVTTAAILGAPYIIAALPSAATVKATAIGAGAKVASMSAAGKIAVGLSAAQMARPLVLQTTEEKLNVLLQEKASRHARMRNEFISCLKANRRNYPRNKSGTPVACEEAALFYAIDSGVPALNKKTDAFKNGKCFCD